MKRFVRAVRRMIAVLCISVPGIAAAAAVPVDLRAGPLLGCLERIAVAFQVRIVDASDRVGSLSCKAAHDTLTLEEALNRLLQPVDLDWHRLRDGTIEIIEIKSEKPASLQLASLTIDGEPLFEPPRTIDPAATPLAERAMAITSLDQRWLATAPILGFNQLGQYAPNVYGTGQSLSMRGIERDSDFFTSLTVSLDGMDLGTRLLDDELVPLDDVTRIDFARGPRAFEVGAASEAGAIAMVTPAPAVEPITRVAIGIGNSSAWDSAFAWSGPLGASGIGATIALDRRVLPDFLHQIVVPQADPGMRQNDSGRLKLAYAPESVPGLSAEFSVLSLSGDSSDRGIVVPLPDANGNPPPFNLWDRNSYSTDPVLAHTHARATAGFARYEGTNGVEFDVHASDTAIVRDLEQLPEEFPRLHEQEDRRRVGISVRDAFAKDWTFVASAERADAEIRTTTVPLPVANGSGVTFVENGAQTTSISAWIEHSWSPEWTVGLGTRVLREISTQDSLISAPSAGAPPVKGLTDNVLSTEPLPLAVVEWHPAAEHTFSLSYGTAYRSAGSVGIGNDYGAEQERNLEASWKARWRNDTVHTSLSLFDATIDDRFGWYSDPVNPNPGRVLLRGAEFEVDATLNPYLQVRAGVGLLPSALYELTGYRDGQRLSGAPRHTFNLNMRLGAAQGWYGATDVYNAARAETDYLGTPVGVRPAYSLLGMKIGYHQEHWDTSIVATNLLDEKYIERIDEDSASYTTPQTRYRLGDPRRVELRTTFTW